MQTISDNTELYRYCRTSGLPPCRFATAVFLPLQVRVVRGDIQGNYIASLSNSDICLVLWLSKYTQLCRPWIREVLWSARRQIVKALFHLLVGLFTIFMICAEMVWLTRSRILIWLSESLDVSDVYKIACRTCEKIVHLDASYINDGLHRADKLYELSKSQGSCLLYGLWIKYPTNRAKPDISVYSYFCLDLSIDPTHAIQNLFSALFLRSSLLHHSHESLLRTHQRLKDLYMRVQDWPSAYRHSRALLDIYYAVYPRNHPLIGVQNLASAKMLLTFEDDFEETLRLLKEAAEVLGIAYGKEHAMTRTARGLMGEVEREVDLRRG